MTLTIPVTDLYGTGGLNAPAHRVRTADDFAPAAEPGVSRYMTMLRPGCPLEALLVNQGSDTLVIGFHGYTGREKYFLPRFEWLQTLLGTEYSALLFSDPALHLSPRLALAWFTGWEELDLQPLLARWAQSAAEAVGARRVIFFGSSGGGFAALQVAPYLPGSLAVPFNPQTAIVNYVPDGNMGNQRRYVSAVMPHLRPPGGVKNLTRDPDWSAPLGARASALVRYADPVPNYVVYAQNVNDISHMTGHYAPFREVIERGPNHGRVHFHEYEGRDRHSPPSNEVLLGGLALAGEWLSEVSVLS